MVLPLLSPTGLAGSGPVHPLLMGVLGTLVALLLAGNGPRLVHRSPRSGRPPGSWPGGGHRRQRRVVMVMLVLLLPTTPSQPFLPPLLVVVSALGLLLAASVLAGLVRPTLGRQGRYGATWGAYRPVGLAVAGLLVLTLGSGSVLPHLGQPPQAAAALLQTSDPSRVSVIAANEHRNLVLLGDGIVWGWGNNFYGQVGDNTTTNRPSRPRSTTSTGSPASPPARTTA